MSIIFKLSAMGILSLIFMLIGIVTTIKWIVRLFKK
jgi:hypothetical protein